MRFFAVFLFLFFLSLSASADVYKWVDKDGTVNFSDSLHNVPSGYRGKAEKISGLQPAASSPLQSGIISSEEYIPFERYRGVMIVDVLINDSVTAKMVFDTGAGRVTISEALWLRMNADPSGRTQSGLGRNVKMHTAGGTVHGRTLTIERVKLGDAYKENVPAILNPSFDTFDGLLGMNFLEEYEVTIDNENSRITLKKRLP